MITETMIRQKIQEGICGNQRINYLIEFDLYIDIVSR